MIRFYSRISLSTVFVFIILTTKGQVGSIKGMVKTRDHQPAIHVSIGLKENNKGSVTSEKGEFIITDIKEGSYTLMTRSIGFQAQEKSVTVIAGQTTEVNFTLTESMEQLAEIVISESRTLNDRTVGIGKSGIKPMDLPQSIAIIDRQILDEQQTLRMSDVLKNVNGVYTMGTTGGTQEEIAGRGFAFGSNNTFKNGVRFNNGVMPETSSLERVEVMKGSNAILFGNVAAGGVLNLVTKKPKFENGGEVSFRTGSYQFYKPSLDLYGAVNNSKKVAYRVNTTYENAKSFRDNVKGERFYINPSLLIKAGKQTEFLLEGDYLKDNRTPDYGIGAENYTILNVPRNTFLGATWGNYEVEQKSITVTITHQLNDRWQLKATAAVQDYTNDLYSTSRPSTIKNGIFKRNLQRSNADETYSIAQLDMTGQFQTGAFKHTLLIGADIDQYKRKNNGFTIYALRSSPDKANAAYDSINVFDLTQLEQRTDIPTAKATSFTKNPVQRAGMYVQDLISVSEKIKVLAGIRYSYLETGSETTALPSGTITSPAVYRYDDAFSPRVGIVYQPVKSTSVFASYANSFTPNTGSDINFKPLAPSIFNQYEAGIKNDLFNGLLSANATVYQIVNSNLSQAVFPAPANPLNTAAQELAGEVTSKGMEVDMMSRSFDGFSIIAGYSYNQTKYTKSNIYEVGSKLRYNPAHTANASIYYTFSTASLLKGFNLGLTGFYMADMVAGRSTQLTVPNDVRRLIPLPNIFQFDLSAGYAFDKVSIRGRVSNVFNELGYYAHDDNSINPIAPRQVAVTLAYKLF